jgi:hypothetical protein
MCLRVCYERESVELPEVLYLSMEQATGKNSTMVVQPMLRA